jgi:hypothetical protein
LTARGDERGQRGRAQALRPEALTGGPQRGDRRVVQEQRVVRLDVEELTVVSGGRAHQRPGRRMGGVSEAVAELDEAGEVAAVALQVRPDRDRQDARDDHDRHQDLPEPARGTGRSSQFDACRHPRLIGRFGLALYRA